jgi:hypothetical protein
MNLATRQSEVLFVEERNEYQRVSAKSGSQNDRLVLYVSRNQPVVPLR